MKKRHIIASGFGLFICGIYLLNASWLAPDARAGRQLLAHRGLHQTFDSAGVTKDTCTAARIDQPRHGYIENTLPAIEAALAMGADIIEFDIHPTVDGEFVVFHDWALSCRTDGHGITRKQTLTYLKSLDIGYGYTADGGETYPFRGQFIGAMPTLNEVLTAFPKAHFLINIKSKSTEEARALTKYLAVHDPANRARLSVYGAGAGISLFSELNPDIKTMSKQAAKSCLKAYILTGWSGHMPKPCHNTYVPVPANYTWMVWGYPNRFEARLSKVGSRSILMGPHIKGKANSGIDNLDALRKVPRTYGGIIWTNRIDLVGSEGGEMP